MIDLEGDGYPFMDFYEGEINTGLDVFAAGFPLGDPEFTLTRGIVSKARAGGETSWASVDAVIEHDATINPGNSGGPLVTARASWSGSTTPATTNTEPVLRHRPPTMQDVVASLRRATSTTSASTARSSWTRRPGSRACGWRRSAPGSPADDPGCRPATSSRPCRASLGTDGTMADYCDILRTPGDDPIQIEVLRFDTSEILTGEINGDEVLTQTFSFAEAVEEETDVVDAGEAATYDSYTTIIDDTGALTIDLPTAWSSLDTAPFTYDDGSSLPQITGAPDLTSYYETWDTPGIFFSLVQSADILQVLATFAPSDACTDGGQYEYQDAAFLGTYQLWTDCGGTDTIFVVLGASTVDGSQQVAVLTAQIVTDADLDALDQAFATFNVTS